jgi:hypothetical protein
VKGSEDTIPPSCVICLPQVEQDSNKVLALEKGILYVVFQVHQVVKGGSVASESTLDIGEKVLALQDPDKTAVYHALHCLAQATEVDRSVTTCQGAVFSRFRNRDYSHFSPGIWYRALCPYPIVNVQWKLLVCGWKVTEHFVVFTVGAGGRVAAAF